MSKTSLISTLTFIIGGATGVVIGILVTKSKFEQKADAEIASVREIYKKYYPVGKTDKELSESKMSGEKVPEDKPTIESNPKERHSGIDYSKMYKPDDEEHIKQIVGTSSTTVDGMTENREQRKKRIYLISPQSFRESSYECKSLLYYADGVLADDDNNVIHTPSELIGDEALESFGRFEYDCVYVRDDNIQVDYEIIKDTRKFEDVLAQVNKHEN